MVLRNNIDYSCEVDHQFTKWSTWTYNINQYLMNLMSTHLYTDLLTVEEKAQRGKPIKKAAGLLPIEKTKIQQMRHVNEAELLRKV